MIEGVQHATAATYLDEKRVVRVDANQHDQEEPSVRIAFDPGLPSNPLVHIVEEAVSIDGYLGFAFAAVVTQKTEIGGNLVGTNRHEQPRDCVKVLGG